MGGSDVLAIILMMMSFAVFFQISLSASRRLSNAQDFLLSGRKVRGSHFQHTLVASGTSLATVLFFFITASKAYGIVFLVNLGTFISGSRVCLDNSGLKIS